MLISSEKQMYTVKHLAKIPFHLLKKAMETGVTEQLLLKLNETSNCLEKQFSA